MNNAEHWYERKDMAGGNLLALQAQDECGRASRARNLQRLTPKLDIVATLPMCVCVCVCVDLESTGSQI